MVGTKIFSTPRFLQTLGSEDGRRMRECDRDPGRCVFMRCHSSVQNISYIPVGNILLQLTVLATVLPNRPGLR
ncbi:hypothetical protein [Hadaka virus 1]|uniref:Uncharacterized protein n=1 Tax=Hadaka virus 1 TaxID=2703488 RepID=A0A6J4BJG2_9VIRU|nr:hypothetical protein QK729_s11gp1 [Hadaka virus 1]BBU94048.1 hypothetical protein [Hadaka virus 1]